MPEIKIGEYYKLLKKVEREGFSNLDESEKDLLLKYRFEVDEPRLQEYISKLDAKERLEPDQVSFLMEEMQKQFLNDKEGLLERAERIEKDKKTKNLTQGVNLLLSGVDFATAQNQINRFKTEEKRSRRPARPAVLQEDPYLQMAKADAARGVYDESTAIEAGKAGIQDAYLGDLQNARISSGGQSGAFGAYAQAASGRRGRRGLELAPMANEIYQQRKARQDRLAGISVQERQGINESAGRNYYPDLMQYQFDQRQLGDLGRAGFSNRRQSMYGLAQQVPGFVDKAVSDKYNRYYSLLGPDWADKAMDAEKKLNRNYQINEAGFFRDNMTNPY